MLFLTACVCCVWAAATSCDSPAGIDTPRVVTRENDGLDGTTPENPLPPSGGINKANSVEREATLSVEWRTFAIASAATTSVSNPTITVQFSMQTIAATASFPATSADLSVNLNLPGNAQTIHPLVLSPTANGRISFQLPSLLFARDINKTAPPQWSVQGYSLGDNIGEWPRAVEILSASSEENVNYLIRRNAPLTIRWRSESAADEAYALLTSTEPVAQGAVEIYKPISALAGEREIVISANEMSRFSVNSHCSILLRFLKTKTTNGGKAALVSAGEYLLQARVY
jgi:hypothetical protein